MAQECLAGRIRILNRVVSSLFDDALRPHHLRVTQMNVLVVIANLVRATPDTGAAAGDICRLLRLEKSTLSRDLDRLLERGLVTATPGTGRTVRLEITAAGLALIENVMPAWEQAQAKTRAMLGEALSTEICRAVESGRLADAE